MISNSCGPSAPLVDEKSRGRAVKQRGGCSVVLSSSEVSVGAGAGEENTLGILQKGQGCAGFTGLYVSNSWN